MCLLNLLPWPKDVDRDAGPGFQPLSSDSPAGLHSIASVEAEDDHRKQNISPVSMLAKIFDGRRRISIKRGLFKASTACN